MYIKLTLRRVASFFKRFFPFTLTTIGTTLSTVVKRFRFDFRDRSQSRRTWNQHWTNSYSRDSHTLYLELRQCLALPVRLRSRESNPRPAPSLLVTTLRHWPFPFGSTVLGRFRTTRSQKNTQKKSIGIVRDSIPGCLISSLTFYPLCHRTPLEFLLVHQYIQSEIIKANVDYQIKLKVQLVSQLSQLVSWLANKLCYLVSYVSQLTIQLFL